MSICNTHTSCCVSCVSKLLFVARVPRIASAVVARKVSMEEAYYHARDGVPKCTGA